MKIFQKITDKSSYIFGILNSALRFSGALLPLLFLGKEVFGLYSIFFVLNNGAASFFSINPAIMYESKDKHGYNLLIKLSLSIAAISILLLSLLLFFHEKYLLNEIFLIFLVTLFISYFRFYTATYYYFLTEKSIFASEQVFFSLKIILMLVFYYLHLLDLNTYLLIEGLSLFTAFIYLLLKFKNDVLSKRGAAKLRHILFSDGGLANKTSKYFDFAFPFLGISNITMSDYRVARLILDTLTVPIKIFERLKIKTAIIKKQLNEIVFNRKIGLYMSIFITTLFAALMYYLGEGQMLLVLTGVVFISFGFVTYKGAELWSAAHSIKWNIEKIYTEVSVVRLISSLLVLTSLYIINDSVEWYDLIFIVIIPVLVASAYLERRIYYYLRSRNAA